MGVTKKTAAPKKGSAGVGAKVCLTRFRPRLSSPLHSPLRLCLSAQAPSYTGARA